MQREVEFMYCAGSVTGGKPVKKTWWDYVRDVNLMAAFWYGAISGSPVALTLTKMFGHPDARPAPQIALPAAKGLPDTQQPTPTPTPAEK